MYVQRRPMVIIRTVIQLADNNMKTQCIKSWRICIPKIGIRFYQSVELTNKSEYLAAALAKVVHKVSLISSLCVFVQGLCEMRRAGTTSNSEELLNREIFD